MFSYINLVVVCLKDPTFVRSGTRMNPVLIVCQARGELDRNATPHVTNSLDGERLTRLKPGLLDLPKTELLMLMINAFPTRNAIAVHHLTF